MHVLATERLILRRLTAEDAAFILRLVNEPSWLRFIGDRGVRDLDDARRYIFDGPVASYERQGFGLYLVERKEDRAALGLCGLIKREALEDVDIGFALLPEHWGKGYAGECAAAVLAQAREEFGLRRLIAITTPDNDSSIRVLEKLGFQFERMVKLAAGDTELKLFAAKL